MNKKPRLFVLDTNVLIHDPSALFRFKEHNVFLPMIVLEELDAAKRGVSEVARSARQASRFLEAIIGEHGGAAIEGGLELPAIVHQQDLPRASGRLFLQTDIIEPRQAHPILPGSSADNAILNVALGLAEVHEQALLTLVSKDINLRIKAQIVGLQVEDYYNDKALDDIDLLYTGLHELDDSFWARFNDREARTDNKPISPDGLGDVYPNEGVFSARLGHEYIARKTESGEIRLDQATDFRTKQAAVWGINARNSEQNFALNLLMDPRIEFVSLLGVAGSGKTLLALAAGLAQCMESQTYREIIMTRETISLGEDIGFLPGTEEEKMTPWMGALLDNLEVLADTSEGGSWGRSTSAEIIQSRIKIRSLSFMRGRTFLQRYIIIDEAQNLTAKQMRTLITRAGSGTKIVCLGNIAQIDTPYLSETTSGLTFVVDRFRRWRHSGHVTLMHGERSRLADFATANL